ncbi:olfactory receptor 10G7-like, partial [Arapaima gigas]
MSLPNETSPVHMSEFIITGFNHLPNRRFLGCLILTAYLFVLFGSSLNVSIIASNRRLHTPMYMFICNLAVVDIMFTTSASTTMIAVLLANAKTISYYSCISKMFVYHFGDISECFAILLMAVDRMVAISNPLRYHSILTNTRTLGLITASWLLGCIAMGFLTRIADGLPYCQPVLPYVFCSYACLIRAACVNPEEYFFASTILSLLVMGSFPCILLTYVKIVYTVLKLSNVASRKQMFATCVSHNIVVASYYTPK